MRIPRDFAIFDISSNRFHPISVAADPVYELVGEKCGYFNKHCGSPPCTVYNNGGRHEE